MGGGRRHRRVVQRGDDGDKKDKYIFVYGSANKKAAKRAAKLMIMTKFLHLLCTGIVVPPFA